MFPSRCIIKLTVNPNDLYLIIQTAKHTVVGVCISEHEIQEVMIRKRWSSSTGYHGVILFIVSCYP